MCRNFPCPRMLLHACYDVHLDLELAHKRVPELLHVLRSLSKHADVHKLGALHPAKARALCGRGRELHMFVVLDIRRKVLLKQSV